ncbi:hypothetical protein BGW36DRAFT_285663 [Talaromyces proteolyticus]|uniref:Uncharacterized protein n=1 Tax=Talaromyces proteolyticus TaxID=1131652 RepID=A0AAD4L3L7_9EURO|nr:uncharacterized protein BGW36DRAFT_285663 [Talaromyces proteolyticus]KAH8705293.1 hypothetical protein BGW36DRAFT_285663 [Talaromyces proteolyticus]
MDLPPPSVLAQLPRPLQVSTGKTQVGEVFSLADSKKRKRYEVAVAVDGEGLNIYNVQSPKLITSHAVPPQSVFSCRPCALRRRVKEKSAVKRHIYCAVERPQKQIKGFFEETVPGSTAAPTIATSSFTLKDSPSPTTFVGIIPRGQSEDSTDESFDLLSVHRNGQVRRFTSDLNTQLWKIQHHEVDNEVWAAFLVEFDDARKSLFKKRPDLAALAMGGISVSPMNDPSVLLLVSHPGSKQGSGPLALNDVKVHIFSIPANCDKTVGSIDDYQRLRHLHTVQLPEIDNLGIELQEPQWTFHSGSAGLSLSFQKGYINCDLSQYSPSVTSKFVLKDENFSSIMRISPYSVIGAGNRLVALYDTHYSSIQRSISTRDLSTNKSSKEIDTKAAMTFVGHFAKLGIVLAVKGNALLAFDLSSTHTIRGTSLKRQRDGLLIDAIGRGVGSSASWNAAAPANSLGITSSKEINKWNTFEHELDKTIRATDAAAFDSAVASYFDVTTKNLSSVTQTSANSEKILFILSKIFTVQQQDKENIGDNSSTLKVSLWPQKTCKWLIELGLLNMDHIETAAGQANKPRILPPFQTGALVQALAEFDPSMKTLTLILKGPASLSAEDLTHALKVFIDLARVSSAVLDQPAMMTITGTADVDMGVDGDSSHHKTGNQTVTKASTTEASLQDAFIGLNLTLSQLHSCPMNRIISALRSTLSNTDTLAIVHHLRVSLATGGYTARFTESPPFPLEAIKAAPPLSLDAIATLMNASVDAIGPSGWISAVEFAGAAVNEPEMTSHMQSEVSAALDGVEEAAYMKGVLGEFIRYGNQPAAKRSSNSQALTKGNRTANAGVKREYDAYGKLWETYTFPKAGEEDGRMLPLSLNASQSGISRTKREKITGAVEQRSVREMAYLQRRAVPEYSVVKIHL